MIEKDENNPGIEVNEQDDQAQSIETTRAELEQALTESKAFQDKFLRQAAELENFRRRTEREKAELLKFANEGLIRDLVPVLDSFNQATESATGSQTESRSILDGLNMVKEQLLSVLKKHGLEVVPAEGHKFDPNLHQAIQRVECEGIDAEVVAQEFAKGYTLNGRLVRPAIVSVSVPQE